jgi:exopolysaccharide biosynthesis polyprenyl glycosylphosphotransferase
VNVWPVEDALRGQPEPTVAKVDQPGAYPYEGQTLTRPAARSKTARWNLVMAALAAVDGVALVVAFLAAYALRFRAGIPFLATPPHNQEFYTTMAFWAIPVWLGVFALYRLYDRHYLFAGLQEYTRLVSGCTVGVLVLIVISFFDLTVFISRGWLLLVWIFSILSAGSARFVFRRLLRRLRVKGLLSTRTLIVGANEEGRALAEQFLGNPGSGTKVVGFVDDLCPAGAQVVGNLANLGGLSQLEEVVSHFGIADIVIAGTALSREGLLNVFRTLGQADGVEMRLSSGLFEVLTTGVTVQEVGGVPLMTPQRVRITGIDAAAKLALDYPVAGLCLLVLGPLLLLIALLVKWDSQGPALHRRRVLGRGGRLFDAYKFRTMVANANEVLAANKDLRQAFDAGFKLKADPRVTRVGRVLRRWSLDELPQLLNVLRGEMSLVGPRMIVPEEAPRYGKWQLNLLTVKPGITGPWQVQGRNDIPYDERVRLSMHYIRNYSIWLDLGILARTVYAVLRGKGAY